MIIFILDFKSSAVFKPFAHLLEKATTVIKIRIVIIVWGAPVSFVCSVNIFKDIFSVNGNDCKVGCFGNLHNPIAVIARFELSEFINAHGHI
jgi:hypothetical protein